MFALIIIWEIITVAIDAIKQQVRFFAKGFLFKAEQSSFIWWVMPYKKYIEHRETKMVVIAVNMPEGIPNIAEIDLTFDEHSHVS